MIYQELNKGYFWEWLQKSDSYKNNFTMAGADVVEDFMERYSEETGENIEFDPIAWCCDFTEYDSFEELKGNYNGIETMEDLENKTMVLSDNPLVIQNF